ncbi:MAG TPA: hypothetical protein DCY86_15480 [Bdellovibrionales bacterium]|nr:MAG: hypothetical protein A2W62_03095 [Alphaproteobacteria bacterium RIFCSPLOWO2_02_42_7]HAZ14189.1 hypothetical protein [Bdellovibrionales bacterium]
MSLQVLREKSEIDRARLELSRRGLSCTSSSWERILRKLGIAKGIEVGDKVKSWDVLKAVNFIEEHILKDAPILDIGAYASELLCALHRLDYCRLTGIDLDPRVKLMPHVGTIHYEVSDFMNAPFKSESFEVITAISVIEHGFDSQSLLSEVSRLLRPGGYFIASFDYWPEKVDTGGILLFGMNWKIFSEEEVLQFLVEARARNLIPCGELALDAQEKAITYGEKSYTFAWLAVRKSKLEKLA